WAAGDYSVRYTPVMSPFRTAALLFAAGLACSGCAGGGGNPGRGDLAPEDFVTPRPNSSPGETTSGTGTEPALERMNTAMEAARQGGVGVDVPVAYPQTAPPSRQPAEPVPAQRAAPADPNRPAGPSGAAPA